MPAAHEQIDELVGAAANLHALKRIIDALMIVVECACNARMLTAASSST